MRPASCAVLALFLLVPAVPAAAGARLEGVPTRVRAGESLRIGWTGLGAGAHEAELELSLAGGRWVRISPELEAREGGFTWCVPTGLSGPARLRLKYGGEWFESEGEVSTPFVIAVNTATTPVRERALDEWWCVGEHVGALPANELAGAASLGRAAAVFAIAPVPPRSLHLVAAFEARDQARDPRPAHAVPPRAHRVSRASYPLRI